ncbi:MAG: RNA pseudouridine synthase, partial [Burkholderiaceae bacterium]
MSEPVRLSKRVAAMLPCSRSDAELYIEGGRVRVDGVLVETPQARVREDQTVAIDPTARMVPLVPVTLLLHKPPGDDWEPGSKQAATRRLMPQNHWGQDRSGNRLLQRHLAGQLCVTPLERAASGLLVFTQEFPVRRKLLEDAALVENEVIVEVQGDVSDAALAQLRRSPVVDGRAM